MPAPRGPRKIAAAQMRGSVQLIRLDRVFTPAGRFRRVIRYHGRNVSVRGADGYHLNSAGSSIAAGIMLATMRRDGIVR